MGAALVDVILVGSDGSVGVGLFLWRCRGFIVSELQVRADVKYIQINTVGDTKNVQYKIQ